MSESLYNFKVGDEVWELKKPGFYGTVLSVFGDDVSVLWKKDGNVFSKRYYGGDGIRPRFLRDKPYSVGVMRHTHPINK